MGCAVSSAAVTPSLHESGLTDGAKFAALPAIEKGALAQGPTVGRPSDRSSASPSPRKGSETDAQCSVSALAAENIVGAASFGRFTDAYSIGSVLGVGSFATVRVCNNQAGDQFAVKIVKLSGQASTRVLSSRMSVRRSDSAWRDRTSGRSSSSSTKEELDDLVASDRLGDLKYLWREIETMKDIAHPHIIRFHGVYLSSTAARVYLVMQYLPGGELLGVLQKKGRFNEDETHQVMVPVLKGLDYLHARGIVHRDIKLENLMLEDASDLSSVKICDFGLAKFTHDGADETSIHLRHDVMATLCGTRVYMPPELVQRQRSACAPPADIWSVGIAFFTMLKGRLPFSPAKDQDGGYERIWRNILSWNPRHVVETSSSWSHISQEAKEFLLRMVEAAPRKRCTAAEALADPWVRRRGPAGSMSDSAAESPTAAVAHSSAQSPGPSASQRASQRGGTFNLAASANPRLIWAHKCLHDLAVQHGHAPTLFTRGDWLIAPPSSSADAAATPRESVLLVTRGELEVIEGPGGRLSGSLNDGAGSPGGGSQHRKRLTGSVTRVECSAPGLIIGHTSLLVQQPLAPAAANGATRDSAWGGDNTSFDLVVASTCGKAPEPQQQPASPSPSPSLSRPHKDDSSLAFAASLRLQPASPVSVRVCSSSAEAIVIPADLVRQLLDETKGLAQTLRSEAGPRCDGKAIVVLGVGREFNSANAISPLQA